MPLFFILSIYFIPSWRDSKKLYNNSREVSDLADLTWLLTLFILRRDTMIWSRDTLSEGTVFVFVSSSLHNRCSRRRDLTRSFCQRAGLSFFFPPPSSPTSLSLFAAIYPETDEKRKEDKQRLPRADD